MFSLGRIPSLLRLGKGPLNDPQILLGIIEFSGQQGLSFLEGILVLLLQPVDLVCMIQDLQL